MIHQDSGAIKPVIWIHHAGVRVFPEISAFPDISEIQIDIALAEEAVVDRDSCLVPGTTDHVAGMEGLIMGARECVITADFQIFNRLKRGNAFHAAGKGIAVPVSAPAIKVCVVRNQVLIVNAEVIDFKNDPVFPERLLNPGIITQGLLRLQVGESDPVISLKDVVQLVQGGHFIAGADA